MSTIDTNPTTVPAPIKVIYVPGESKELPYVHNATVRDYLPDLSEKQSVTVDGTPVSADDIVVHPGANLVVASSVSNG